jgi:quercetin dioxygenase-like cupin family protein
VTAWLLALALAGPVETALLDNASVTVTRQRFDKGAGEAVHTHPFPLLIVQLTPGDLDLSNGDGPAPRAVGSVTYVPADTPHAAVNSGDTPFELIAVALKTTRPPAPSAPATDAPPGITRTLLLDNGDVRVVRVRFAPGSREPVHTHPNDLLTVQLTAGQFAMQVGNATQRAEQAPGFTKFLPRNVSHAYINGSSRALDLLSISIK